MRIKIVITGVIIIAVGVLLFAYGFFFPPRDTVVDTQVTIKPEYYQAYYILAEVGQSLMFSFSCTEPVALVVLDSENWHLWDAGENFHEIYFYVGTELSYSFHATKTDEYYFAVTNMGGNDVTVSCMLTAEKSYSRYIYFVGIGLGVVGVISTIAGLVLKPRVAEIPRELLDTMKLHKHMKISDLATRFKTTEADVELAAIKLRSRGEPIQFDKETRELIYIPLKEEKRHEELAGNPNTRPS